MSFPPFLGKGVPPPPPFSPPFFFFPPGGPSLFCYTLPPLPILTGGPLMGRCLGPPPFLKGPLGKARFPFFQSLEKGNLFPPFLHTFWELPCLVPFFRLCPPFFSKPPFRLSLLPVFSVPFFFSTAGEFPLLFFCTFFFSFRE